MAEEKTTAVSKAAKDAKSFNLSDFVKAHIAEFKRIIWPNRETLIKETITVIFVSLILGAIIILLDTAYQFGFDALIGLFS